jgi:hypothetical protein
MLEDMENVLQKSYPEQSIVASVKCLRLLWEGFPKCVRLNFGRRDLERCEQSFELWYTTLAPRLPAEHRAAIRSEAMLEFALFRETVLALPNPHPSKSSEEVLSPAGARPPGWFGWPPRGENRRLEGPLGDRNPARLRL